jgi:HAE1 family hydrophobic/amphiphilic exporter-1
LINYCGINLRDQLPHPGIAQVDLFGTDYDMRIWLKPDRWRSSG